MRNYEFIMAGHEFGNNSNFETKIFKVDALSLEEAISHAYIHAHNLKNVDQTGGLTWKIVKATDVTYFNDVKKF
jgi:hypothetical protein